MSETERKGQTYTERPGPQSERKRATACIYCKKTKPKKREYQEIIFLIYTYVANIYIYIYGNIIIYMYTAYMLYPYVCAHTAP